jgi:hypothetical protein
MKKSRAILALAVISIVLLAGCGGKDAKTIFGYGVVMTDFSAEYSEVDSDDYVEVFLEFENRGEKVAEDIQGSLVRKGSFSASPAVQDEISMLELPLESEYDNDYFTWTLHAPTLQSDRTEEVQARISYNYETTGVATIHFVPKTMLRDEGSAQFSMDPYSSDSPLSVDITARQPVEVTNEGTEEVQVTIILDNIDMGTIESRTAKASLPTSCNGKQLDCIDEVIIDVDDNCKGLLSSEEDSNVLATWECDWNSDTSRWFWNNEADGETKTSGDFKASYCPAGTVTHTCENTRYPGIIETNACNGKEESGVDANDPYGQNVCYCLKEEASEAPVVASFPDTHKGVRMIHGEQARITETYAFPILDSDAATSCQLSVKAKYTYRLDSEILPITILKE